jgi:hypothetical protein
VSAVPTDDLEVSSPPVDTARIRRIAGLTYRAAEGYIALGQKLLGSKSGTRPPPSGVVTELDQISEHLLGLATHLSRLAAAIEKAGPPRASKGGKFAEPKPDS